jgi:hypothetical protein
MKNPFKLFFLTSYFLVSLFSTVTPVANSSFPLAESDFTIGKNSSQVTERASSIISVYGGITVWGIRKEGSGGSIYQRPCTLSFPVRNHRANKGYLTSYFCTNTNVFLDNSFKTEVGRARPIGIPGLDPERGLDYIFIKIYDDYWDDLKSPYVAFNEIFNHDRFDLLAMTIPTQPPFIDITVCAYGGLKSEMACGVISEFDVTIFVPTLWTKSGKDSVKFSHAIKIIMNKNYNSGYLGAPIYIAEQIPFDTQLIVAPVGQVVETIEQYNAESQEPNVWYYIPIERILQDGVFELLLGHFD